MYLFLLCHWNEHSLMQAQSIALYLLYFLYTFFSCLKVETLVDLHKQLAYIHLPFM